jgi:hypothetical protein
MVMRKSFEIFLTGNKEIACKFKDMFAKLLNQPIINITVDELTIIKQLLDTPSKNEVETRLNMLKYGKAPGDYKILPNIFLIKINPYIKEIIGGYQAGFIIGRSTVNQNHITKQLAEMNREFNKDIHLMFINY